MWEIRRYSDSNKKEWNDFVAQSRNSTFLFDRNYMDYHSDRFSDYSLMAYRHGKLAAVLPANEKGDALYSHLGLTYGGWVWAPRGLDTTDLYLLWHSWIEYCSKAGFERIIYKPLPYIYSEMPSQEDLYFLFLSKANLISTDISTTIDLESDTEFNMLQKRHLKKVPEDFYCEVVNFEETGQIKDFHKMLSLCLEERHDNIPVHSLDELERLMAAFPEDIVIWGAYSDGKLQAGICVYEAGITAHCQYIATTAIGRERNLLPPLVKEMLDYYTEEGFRYFDFGTSNEGNGQYLNNGLNRQKTSFGGSGVAYSKFEINLSSALASLQTSLWPPK